MKLTLLLQKDLLLIVQRSCRFAKGKSQRYIIEDPNPLAFEPCSCLYICTEVKVLCLEPLFLYTKEDSHFELN
jgi:hypothetical protein